ncbi:Lrp/AsnC family transcriptional regulator [Stackebrandtia nassauensis]|uniref:Transcriptional regulator, AsnC family n=1 Tax=Stackebrandtia nassauensis (strain DSM 44728 / CIP 108903 / NRRL B-16338 / NBRC 102104 / LLR-40K-21) TaxID=446470 RepID=D3Q6N2_STANL|nr:Lrp/AsnC family transcriptional regulator [Stackebrandtia nassauensis]ADD44275.1 transcriptional regulator, AsnC family [Stackebrandtia nassauensis DSM 44728]
MSSSTASPDNRIDDVDRAILAALQHDATRPYAELGKAVGLSAGAAHERVRKLRERGVVRATTIDVDAAALGKPVLSFVTLDAADWMGGSDTAEALAAIPEIEEAHIVAGSGTVLLKVRTASTQELQSVLKRLYAVDTVATTHTTVVLETLFTRPVAIADRTGSGGH